MRPLQLVETSVSHDTVRVLRALLAEAERGEVIGIAYAALYPRRRYVINATGEAWRNPTFSRGMLAALDNELGQQVRG